MGGYDLKVPDVSYMMLNCTGVSLVLLSWIVWYTDSLGLQGAKAILVLLILIIGMKGCELGGKEWPDKRTLRHTGGSISSWDQSAYLADLTEPRSVLLAPLLLAVAADLFKVAAPTADAPMVAAPIVAPAAANYFILPWLPFWSVTKH